MNAAELVARINDDACIDVLADMIRAKSYTETSGERQLAETMCQRMQALGLESELQPVTGHRVNAIGRWQGAGGGPSLLFNGHLDTNPVTEGWTVDPWGAVNDGQFIFGIGVSNMKSGDAAYFCALKTLIDAGARLKGDVILSFVVGELQGGVGTVRAIEQGLKADYFINAEPTDLGALTLHAGAMSFEIELTGDTRHLSKREEACNALAAAAALAPRIDAITFSGAATPEHRSINRGHVGVLRAGLSREFHEWRPPQVADYARLLGTARYAPSQSRESVLADLQRMLDALELEFPGLQSRVAPLGDDKGHPHMPPFEVSRDSRVVTAVNAAYRETRGAVQPTGPIRPPAFYGTDAAHLAQAEMQGVVCGPGGEFNTMPDERVRIRDYLDCVRIYLLAMSDICELT